MNSTTNTTTETLDALFTAGAHYGLSRSRRHPSSTKFLYTNKDRMDVFDLNATHVFLEQAKDFARSLGRERKMLLFVGGKPESHAVIKQESLRCGAAYSVGRWIGGTITNFPEIKRRVARMQDLIAKRESGALVKYTKFERLQIDREIERLEGMYAGLVDLGEKLPHAIFVVDPKREHTAIKEAHRFNIPVIALANSDCNISDVTYPIPANDSARKSIAFVVHEIADAYLAGQSEMPVVADAARA